MPRHKSRRIIESYEAKTLKRRSLTVRVADYLTSFFGSLFFLFINLIVFAGWILINLGYITIPGIPAFDPYPFVLLITAVSLEAIILATVVLISQNRESHINTIRDELQLQVNLLSEREITKILQLMRLILKERGIKISDEELSDMLKEVDTTYIERELEKQLSPKSESITKKVEETLTPKKKSKKK